ncbi:MAG: hypothetical protein ACTHW1_00770 [Ancrocorticia sp.]|uniref:hypothetical protein n=1 Tax=Ancrocorticia sp. TaxID=2593684 RepID=UPI003F9378C3
MPSDYVLSPSGPKTPFIVAFIVAALVLVAWVAYLLWQRSRSRQPAAVVLASFTPSQKEQWLAAIRQIGEAYLPPQSAEAVRQLHKALGKEMRRIISERSGRDLSSWSTGEMMKQPQLTRVATLMSTWEQPTFAANPEAEGIRSVNGAMELIAQW